MPEIDVRATLAQGEKAARDAHKSRRVTPLADPEPIKVGEIEIGSWTLAEYRRREGDSPVPVLVERIGSTERMIQLVTVDAAARALGLGTAREPREPAEPEPARNEPAEPEPEPEPAEPEPAKAKAKAKAK